MNEEEKENRNENAVPSYLTFSPASTFHPCVAHPRSGFVDSLFRLEFLLSFGSGKSEGGGREGDGGGVRSKKAARRLSARDRSTRLAGWKGARAKAGRG